jgi:hypothetical protein
MVPFCFAHERLLLYVDVHLTWLLAEAECVGEWLFMAILELWVMGYGLRNS